MDITSFDDLLRVAGQQSAPQRLLFVFLRTVLQKDASEEEKAGFEAGIGGALEALSSVDLGATDIPSFASLQLEADRRSPGWDKILVACMDETPLASTPAANALKLMTTRVQSGSDLSSYLCFDRSGTPLQFG